MSIELGVTIPANEDRPSIPIESVIRVIGLRPPVLDSNGQVGIDGRTNKPCEGNLEEKLPEIEKIIKRAHHWLPRLVGEVTAHKKSAIVFAAVGGLTILSAVGAGYEFGIKHGEDIRDFYSRIQRIKRKF